MRVGLEAPRIGRVRSLIELLGKRAAVQPTDRAYTFLEDGEREGDRMTWGELEGRARALAHVVSSHAPGGSRVLIMCPPGLDFITAFFATLGAGAIAVPCYPPRLIRTPTGGQDDRTLDRLRAIVRNAEPALVLASSTIVERAPGLTSMIPELGNAAWSSTDVLGPASASWPVRSTVSDVAFLQYTSGSTAEPRGVMVTHGNLLHNLADAHALAQHDERSASVSWLPVIHDMGLIQGVLQPAFSGFPGWLMSPAAFLQRPERWLRAITNTRATISGAPNFAYDLCSRRIVADRRSTLDLRSWRVAFNGAEPIRQATLDRFAEAFAGSGFDAQAFRPAYGLAEATLLVSTGLGRTTSCGTTAPLTRIRIVDAVTCEPCPDGATGEIWIDGPSVAAGYWAQPDATRTTFGARIARTGEGPFLRSGDLGSLHADGLHVTGRIKDVLIVRGVKHFPQDLEETIEHSSQLVRPGCCAVFTVPGPTGDLIGVAAEIDAEAAGATRAGEDVIARVREAVGTGHGVQVSVVALIAPGTIPKTTSGKLQRYACRELLVAGAFAPLAIWSTDEAPLAEAS